MKMKALLTAVLSLAASSAFADGYLPVLHTQLGSFSATLTKYKKDMSIKSTIDLNTVGIRISYKPATAECSVVIGSYEYVRCEMEQAPSIDTLISGNGFSSVAGEGLRIRIRGEVIAKILKRTNYVKRGKINRLLKKGAEFQDVVIDSVQPVTSSTQIIGRSGLHRAQSLSAEIQVDSTLQW